jgi:hypothetical protein
VASFTRTLATEIPNSAKNAFIDTKVPFTFLERSEGVSVRITATKHSIWVNSFSDYQWEGEGRVFAGQAS